MYVPRTRTFHEWWVHMKQGLKVILHSTIGTKKLARVIHIAGVLAMTDSKNACFPLMICTHEARATDRTIDEGNSILNDPREAFIHIAVSRARPSQIAHILWKWWGYTKQGLQTDTKMKVMLWSTIRTTFLTRAIRIIAAESAMADAK